MVKLEEHKHLSGDKSIEGLPVPARVYLPMVQHLGKACVPEVKVGDEVGLGQRIASVQAHITSPIHASVAGKVAAIQEWPHPVLGRAKAIVIEAQEGRPSSGQFSQRAPAQVEALSSEEIRKIINQAGIVGMGGAGFPSHVKLTPAKPIDTLIVNGAECEPYLTGDYRLMLEKTSEIILAIEVVRRCLGAKQVVVAIEENKPEAVKLMKTQDAGRKTQANYKVQVLKSAYPQGGEKQLIKNTLGKEVPRGKLPFDVGVVVHNIATLFAIYEAVYLGKPLYERVVTVTGNCLKSPKNLLVPIGTPIKELIAFCGPLTARPAKIIMGGPMMGIAQYTDSVPVIKTSGGLILWDKQAAKTCDEEACIRCGACVRDCPAGLMPCLINAASVKEFWPLAKEYGALDCIECGVCSYVCPAGRRLVKSIKRAKLEAAK